LLVTLFGADAYMGQDDATDRLFKHPAIVAELRQILEVSRATTIPHPRAMTIPHLGARSIPHPRVTTIPHP
jgi:hypothetical protein